MSSLCWAALIVLAWFFVSIYCLGPKFNGKHFSAKFSGVIELVYNYTPVQVFPQNLAEKLRFPATIFCNPRPNARFL